jgi:transposase
MDVFKCLKCGHEDESDRVAAENYAGRSDDPEIELKYAYSK